MKSIILLLSLVFYSSGAKPEQTEVYRIDQSDLLLAERFKRAMHMAEQIEDSFWFGYSFQRITNHHTTIRTHYHDQSGKTLIEILYGADSNSVRESAERALHRSTGDNMKIQQEMAILLHFNYNKSLREVRISDLNQYTDLKRAPIIWSGMIENHLEGIELLQKFYNDIKDSEIRKDIITAIALHQQQPQVKDFLVNIIEKQSDTDLRANAVFWLGQQDLPEVARYLYDLAGKDESPELRKKAVFSLSQTDSPQSIDYMIDLARNNSLRSIRKEAIFWLGQIASEKSANILQDIIQDEEDLELREQAVFALAQLPDEEGIPHLIKIAQEHPNTEIRKKAIFWLGQSGDPRALDVIINIIKNE